MKRQYTIYNICVLLALLFLGGGWNMAWGQQTFDHTITLQRYEQYGLNVQDIYFPNNISADFPKKIRLQKSALENIDGYIHWYIKKKDGTITTSGLQRVNGTNNYNQYNNGYVWIREDDGISLSNDQNSIAYNGTGWVDGDTLVCEASSLNNATWKTYRNPWNRYYSYEYIQTSPMITVVHKYALKQASGRSNTLSTNLTNLNKTTLSSWISDSTDFVSLIDVADSYFMETYDIYTPLTGGYEERAKVGTNYRLEEELSNYYVSNNNEANQVRWSAFRSTGGRMIQTIKNKDDDEGDGEDKATIWNHAFGFNNDGIDLSSETEQVAYITAEVSNNGSTWYPVAFMTIHLMPYYEALTVDELDNKVDSQTDRANYYPRTETYLERNGYRKLNEVTFDDIPTEGQPNLISLNQLESDIKQNYATQPMPNANTNYAFANPSEFPYRKKNRLSVGRGEYGLYRSLNYATQQTPGNWEYERRQGWVWHPSTYTSSVSKGDVNISIGEVNGSYQDYFAADDRYNKYIFDRTYEKAGLTGSNMGYFLYLDATDEPGVITNMALTEPLCPNTKLIVTAWVCDMAHSESGLAHADIGFTFKGKKGNQETILAKYYSGKIINKPAEWGNVRDHEQTYQRALWQQVYFTFSYAGQVDDYDSFLVEIANNAPSSNGADYAIDDIQVWCSTPDIRVQRRDACDASSLVVSSVYNTVLSNMGWNEGQDVLAGYTTEELKTNMELRKYRYGLNGDYNDSEAAFQTSSTVGNVYFAFMDGIGNADKYLSDIKWIVINKDLDFETHPGLERAAKSMRFVVSTDININGFPTSEGEAIAAERTLNLRAIDDYNADVEDGKWDDKGYSEIIVDTNEDGTVSDEEYHTAIETLYERLQIPRIRCPWKEQLSDGSYMLYMTTLDVYETELKYMGEDDGTENGASGQYEVIVFSAAQIVETTLSIDECSLISPFTVLPATTITIKTAMGEPETAACAGSLRRITAKLNGYDVDGNIVDLEANGIKYLFDWYLGSMDSYIEDSLEHVDQSSNASIKQIIEAYRDEKNDNDNITIDELEGWNGNGADRLIKLINSGLLLTGKEGGNTFDLELPDADRIVAMPYVYANTSSENYTFCTWKTELSLPVEELDIPVINPGFPGITELDGGAPLRLGLRNMENTVTLKIPFTEYGLQMADGASYLGVSGNPEISFREGTSATLTPVGNVSELKIPKEYSKTSDLATITITWNKDAVSSFEEGHEYELLFPFVQYDSNDQVLSSQCDGLGSLKIKIVPEYLTWQGDGSDVWYNDDNWNQSTEEELYMGDETPNKDANGDDEITNAFAPLYFTKITINPKQDNDVVTADQLNLLKETKTKYTITSDGTTNTYELLNFGNSGMNISSNTTLNIEYDMAVDTIENGIKVVPYYGNKVDQIYFKPEATLMNQHYLDYQKAWVDFEMEAGKPYWMSAPLKGVYAGDMYAPSSNGRQETEAFTDITYSGKNEGGNTNSRWNPAFYQKAWDKAIRYAASDEDNDGIPADDEIANVNAVKSNWSIEYNDVTVPYSLGKGFYSKVEKESEGNVLVRLPKADTEYKYETKTRALTNTEKQPSDYGKLADGLDISIDLSKEDTETTQEEVDGDGKHFLVGNPYMSYLKMTGEGGFLTANSDVLANKFWTLDRANGSIVVGTPDVTNWDDASGVHIATDGQDLYVAPMTAFFVELSDNAGDNKTIEFTTAMMAAKPMDGTIYTKSYSASNPILTLTAERGETRSVARLLTSDKGHDEYEASEDAVLLLDSELDAPMVYTVAGDVAAQFNTMQSIKNVPVGVYNKEGDEVTLTISGLSRLVEPLYLYDAWTGKSKELTGDSYQLTVEGESLGRYYLRNEALASELESTISIYSLQPGEIVAASSGAVLRQVRVYSVNGELVTQRSAVGQTACRLSVPRGAIYMIYAEDTKGNSQSVKLRVR